MTSHRLDTAFVTLEQRLELARRALSDALRNADDPAKNSTYWQMQVGREQRLVDSLETEMRHAAAED